MNIPTDSTPVAFVPHPGRPKGSGLDDTRALAEIAALLQSGEAGTVTAAVRRVAGDDPATIRRLQRKFAARRAELIAAHTAAQQLASQRDRSGVLVLGVAMVVMAFVGLCWHFQGLAGGYAAFLALPIIATAALWRFAGAKRSERRPEDARIRQVADAVLAAMITAALGVAIWPGVPSEIRLVAGALAISLLSGGAITAIHRASVVPHRQRGAALAAAGGALLLIGATALPVAMGIIVVGGSMTIAQAEARADGIKAMGRLLDMIPPDRREEARASVVLPAYRRMHDAAHGRRGNVSLPVLRALVPGSLPNYPSPTVGEASLVLIDQNASDQEPR